MMYALVYLKSNMDRFIEDFQALFQSQCCHLKSNMDRFIVKPSMLSLTLIRI